jgi:hypothetical protein
MRIIERSHLDVIREPLLHGIVGLRKWPKRAVLGTAQAVQGIVIFVKVSEEPCKNVWHSGICFSMFVQQCFCFKKCLNKINFPWVSLLCTKDETLGQSDSKRKFEESLGVILGNIRIEIASQIILIQGFCKVNWGNRKYR